MPNMHVKSVFLKFSIEKLITSFGKVLHNTKFIYKYVIDMVFSVRKWRFAKIK